jgi:sugar phosphate permease
LLNAAVIELFQALSEKLIRLSTKLPAMVNRSWLILAVCFLLAFTMNGVQSSFALFILPMVSDLGWNISSLALAATICMLSTGISLPVIGRLADRYSPKVMILIGGGLAGIGVLFLSFVQSILHVYLFYGLLFGLTWMSCGLIATTAFVTRLFFERRGLAISILQSAFPLGWFCIVPLTQISIQTGGWRIAWLTLGSTLIFIVLIAIFVLKDSKKSCTYLNKKSSYNSVIPIRKALRSSFYILIGMVVQLICGFTDIPLTTLWIPISIELGIKEITASYTLGFMGAIAFFGTITIGLLSEKLGRKIPVVLSFAIRFISIFVLFLVNSYVSYYVFLILLSFSLFGMVPVISTWFSEVFGEESVGTLFGFSQLIHFIGAAAGIYILSLLAEIYQTYHPAFIVCLVLLLLNVLSCLAVRTPTRPPTKF